MKSQIKLDTSKDILTFLKILAEESTKDAYDVLNDQELIDDYNRKLKADEDLYGKLDVHEQEEDAEEADDAEVDDETVPDEPVDDEPVDDEPVEQDSEVSLEVSLDSITSSIKQLRSGKSVDDTLIKDQLRVYFDRLDETERGALLAFLKAFSGILTGVSAGDNAPDPSDPPYNISMSHGEEDSGEEEIEVDEEPIDEPEEEPADEEEEPEDTAPPIKVGESQSLDEIRKRVRKLMNRH
jgi:hypothetical protein